MASEHELIRKKTVELEHEISHLQDQLSTLVKESEHKDVLCLKYQSDIQNSLVVVQELEEKLQTRSAEYKDLEGTLQIVNKDKEQLQEKVTSLGEEISTCQNLIQTLNERLDGVQEELHSANFSIETLKNELEEKQNNSSKEKAEMELLLNEQRTNLMEKETELEQLVNKIKTLESEGGNQEVWAKQLEEGLIKVKSESQVLILKNEELNALVSENDSKLGMLNDEIRDLHNANEKAKYENEALTESLNLLTNEVKQTRSELESALACVEKANSNVQEYEVSLNNVNSELSDVQAELVRLRLENQGLVEERSGLETQLRLSENRADELLKEIDHVKENFSAIELELKNLKEQKMQQVMDHETVVSQLEAKIKILQSQLQEDEMKYRETIDMMRLEEIRRQNEMSDSKSTLEANFEGLVSQLSVLETERNNILQEKLVLTNKIEELQKFYDQCQIQEVELQKCFDKMEVLQSEVALITEEKNRLRDQNDRLLEYNQQLEADLTSTFEAAKTLENEKESLSLKLNGEITVLNEKCMALESDLTHEREIKHEKEIIVADLIAKFSSMQNEHQQLLETFANAEKELLTANEYVQKLNNELVAVQDKNSEILKENQDYKQLLDSKSNEIEKITEELRRISGEKQQLFNQQQVLMEKSSSMERDIEINNSLNRSLESALAEISQERQSLDKKINELREEIERLNNEMVNKNLEIEQINKYNVDINFKFQESEVQKQEACHQLQEIKEEFYSLQTSSSKLIDTTKQEVQVLQTQMSSTAQQLQILTDNNAAFEKQIVEKDLIIQNLEILTKDLQQDIILKNDKVVDLENVTLSLTQKVKILESNMNDVSHRNESTKEELQKQIELLLLDSKNQNELLQKLQTTIKEQEQDIILKGNHILDLEKASSALTQQLAALELNLGDVEQKRADFANLNENLRQQIDQLTNDMQEKDLVVQRYDAMMKDLQQAINLKNSQVSELENENVTLTQKLADLELNVNEMEQKNRELVNLNQSIAHQNDQMLKDAQEKDMIVQQYDIMIKDLQQEIHLKDSRVAELENSAIDLTQKIIDLESSVADMSQTNKEVASLNQDLRQSVEKLMEEIQNKTLLLESYSLEKETEKELLIQRYEDMIKDIQHDATLKYNRNVELENSTLVLTQNIGDLEKSKRDVEQINKDITAANLELNNRVDQLLAEINNKNEMIEAVQASNEELNLRCSSLLELQKIPQIADEVAVANLEIRDLELGPQSSEERLTQKQVISENSHTDKDNTIENLNNKISNLKKECEEKDNKIEDLSSQLLAVHNEIRKSQSELADIGDKLIAKENQMTGMSSSVENLKHSLQDSTFQLELSRKEVLNLDEKLRQSNKESEDRIELLKQEIIKLQASLHGHSERNVSLERDKQANDELEKGSQELSLIKDTFQNAFNESKIDNTKSRNAQSDRQTFETSESHIAKLNQEIERLNVKLGDFVHLQEKLEEAEKVNRKLNEEKSTWENRIDDSDIKESNTKELEKNLALQQTVDNLKHEVGALQDEKRSYQTELEECKAVIAKLNDEKVELEALVKKMESSVEKRSEKGENIVLVIDSDHHSATSELQRRDSPQVNERLLSTPSTSLQTTDASHSSPDHKQLKNKLAVLQIKNEKMLTKLKLFKDKNDKLQLQINDLMAVRAALEDDRVRMIEYNERAKNEIHRLSTELRNLERMWKTEVKMLQDRLDTVEIANSKLVEIKEHLERTLVTTTEQNELFRREKSNLERNVAKMNEEREFLNNKHKDAIDQLSQEIQQWQRQVDSLKKHNGFLESDNLEFQDLISKLQSEKAKSDQNLKAQNEKCESLTVELQKLKGGLRDLQPEDIGNVADLKKNYTALQKDYKELINIRVQLEAEIEDLRTELQEAFRDRAQLEKERDDLRATLQNKQSNSGAIEGSKDIELRELVKELSDTKIESSELCETVTLLKNELQDSKLENGLLKQTLQELSVKESQSNKMDDDRMQLESLINDLKLQNSDLIAKKSALEVEVWKLEEDKQQIAEDAQLNQQKSVNKVMADLEKFQVENQKLKEELEAQDSELRILEKEKEQIEAESRLTFQQQQETIKHLHSNVHNLQEELTTLNERNTKYEISMQNLQGELAEVQRQFEEVLLNLNAERGRALHFEAINTALQVEIEELKTKMVEHETDKADLIGEIGKLRDENASFVHKLGNLKKHLKSANEGVDMRDEVTEESLQRSTRELNKSHDHNDLNTKSREVDYLKMQITKLEAELQQVMVSLHSKDVRCEELTSEISDVRADNLSSV